MKKRDDFSRLLHTRPTFSKSVMVSVAVSASRDGVFAHPLLGTRRESERWILSQCCSDGYAPSWFPFCFYFVFQQDGAPAHRAHDTVELLRAQTPDFIPPDLWPLNSPDLNPVDYSIWRAMQEKVYHTYCEYRRAETSDQRHIAAAIGQWRCRLSACVKAQGGYFEHLLRWI